MTYNEIIDRTVRRAAADGMTVGDITLPLLNMAATILANAVVQNKLDAAEEIELVQGRLEDLYEQYLEAYNKQEVRS